MKYVGREQCAHMFIISMPLLCTYVANYYLGGIADPTKSIWRFIWCFLKASQMTIVAFRIAVYYLLFIKWKMFNIKGRTNLSLFEGGFCHKKKNSFSLSTCCTLFRMYERGKTLDGKTFQVHGMCLNLLLLNQRADSGSLSFYYPLETYSEYYVIKLGKRGGSAQTAEQRQCKQLCQCKQQSDYFWGEHNAAIQSLQP